MAGGRALAGTVVALWAAVVWPWSAAWSVRPELAYGWAVPLLAAALAWERAKETAEPGPALTPGRQTGCAIGLFASLVALPVALTILAANPLWPLAQWSAFAPAAAATLAALALAGGSAMARRYAFPVLFVGTALVWPTMVTVRLVGTLVGVNAALAANVVSALGHPAVVHGGVIELAAGFVGVDEACSGLRSLQTVGMAGWFFGELFRLRARRRIGLVAAALVSAVVVNWLRTTALTWIAAAQGIAASEHWHDRLGALELGVTLAIVAGLAWRAGRATTAAAATEPARSVGGATTRAAGGFPVVALLVGAALAAAVPAVWYRAHERAAQAAGIRWELRAPGADWRPVVMPPRTEELLQATTLRGFARTEPGGGESLVYLASWDDDGARAASAEIHDPTICLPAAGVEPEIEPAPVTVTLDGVSVAFTEATFTTGGREQRVFYCHWDAWLGRARGTVAPRLDDVVRWRLARVWAGRRRGDMAYLVMVTPADNESAARAWLRAWAPRVYRRR